MKYTSASSADLSLDNIHVWNFRNDSLQVSNLACLYKFRNWFFGAKDKIYINKINLILISIF